MPFQDLGGFGSLSPRPPNRDERRAKRLTKRAQARVSQRKQEERRFFSRAFPFQATLIVTVLALPFAVLSRFWWLLIIGPAVGGTLYLFSWFDQVLLKASRF